MKQLLVILLLWPSLSVSAAVKHRVLTTSVSKQKVLHLSGLKKLVPAQVCISPSNGECLDLQVSADGTTEMLIAGLPEPPFTMGISQIPEKGDRTPRPAGYLKIGKKDLDVSVGETIENPPFGKEVVNFVAPAPSNLSAFPVSDDCMSYNFYWNGLAGSSYYRIYAYGVFTGAIDTSPPWYGSDRLLVPNEEVPIQITAVDASGNESPPSTALNVLANCNYGDNGRNIGQKRSAVILTKFPGGSEPVTPAAANDFMVGFAAFVAEVSYNQMSIVHYVPNDAYFTAPHEATYYCFGGPSAVNADGWCANGFDTNLFDAEMEPLLAPHITADTVYRFYVMSGFVGGFGGGTEFHINADRLKPDWVAHEFGHILNGLHGGSVRLTLGAGLPSVQDISYGTGFLNGYGDHWDPLGLTYSYRHYSPFHKLQMGWLPPSTTKYVTSGGVYKLDAIEPVNGGVRDLRIPLGLPGHFYMLEFRAHLGINATPDLGCAHSEGVIVRVKIPYVHRYGGGAYANDQFVLEHVSPATGGCSSTVNNQAGHLGDILTLGKTWDDTYRDLAITYQARVGTTAYVRIDLPPGGVSKPFFRPGQ